MRICVVSFSLLIGALAFGQGSRPQKDGYVPDSATAVKIGEAKLVPVYGKKHIESEEPFTATLKDNVWTVSGTLHCSDGKGGRTTGDCVGGVAVVQISKANGHVISMTHGR